VAKTSKNQEALFIGNSGQLNAFNKSVEQIGLEKGAQVECLGQFFDSEEARREHFLGLLAEKLKDPAFRKIPGFPKGKDEDILRLSDPPWYTACPNPFLEDFVKCYGKPYDPADPYRREPFAVDVSEGKTNALYKAHGYHTKVPHLAIVPSIRHYTKPGDIVLDGFCGSGMTGVAAQFCGTAPAEYRKKVEEEWKQEGLGKPEWGTRRVILNDLSPAATFIAANYNIPFDVDAFAQAAERILEEVETELGWMYQTLHVEPASSRLLSALNFKCPTGEPGIQQFTTRRDHLPHMQDPGAFYFLTFNTQGRRELSPQARQAALDAIKFWHSKRLRLIAAVVMPDHVHAVLQPLEKESGTWWDLSTLLHSIKSYSANQINQLEDTHGAIVWQSETYDHIIRDERELGYFLQYIAMNPVTAKLVERQEEYEWCWVEEEVKMAGWKPAPLGRINYTVWSEVFSCPECGAEINFVKEALDTETKRVREEFLCPKCDKELTKDNLNRTFEHLMDPALNTPWKRVKFQPALINYSVRGATYEKTPDEGDLARLREIETLPIPFDVPTNPFPIEQMYHGSRLAPKGFTHVHHMFLPRATHSLSALWRKAAAHKDTRVRNMLLWFVEQAIWTMSILNRFRPTGFSQVSQYLTGVYYVPSQHSELSSFCVLNGKLKRLMTVFCTITKTAKDITLSCGDCSALTSPDSAVDYIFTDPPFGENIYYADLNFLVESWHRVVTDAGPEAIVDRAKRKGVPEYLDLMRRCFQEYHRVLKPGRWMTVVFSNSSDVIWRAIQEAMGTAGFVIADVRTLDKQQGSYRQVTSSAVKQDLVISAYKPNEKLTARFELGRATTDDAWAFVTEHLINVPVFVGKENRADVIVERTAQRLFDRMIAFHVQRGLAVPIGTSDFNAGLDTRFSERDGMYFLPDQVAEYDRKRSKMDELGQLELFVNDEASAIQWVRHELKNKPQSRQDMQPHFMRQTQSWAKHEETVDLKVILEQNCLLYEGVGPVPSQIHSYLSSNFKEFRSLDKEDMTLMAKARDRWYVPDPSKAGDLEKLREKALLREFETYKDLKQRKLKQFRTEAMRAGFAAAYKVQDYRTIVDMAQKIPENVLQEDEKLLMYYDMASMRAGEE